MTRRLLLMFLAAVLVAVVLSMALEDPAGAPNPPTITEAPR